MVLSPHPRCLFPVIEHHVPPRIGHGFFKAGADVRNTEHSRTLSFCAENSLSLLAFYKTVWALILKQFANTDHVYFGVVDTSHTTRGMPSAPGGEAQEQEHSKTQSWCHVHLSSTDTLLEILEQLESEPRRGYPAEGLGGSSLCFNTEIHLLEGDVSDYTGGNDIYPVTWILFHIASGFLLANRSNGF